MTRIAVARLWFEGNRFSPVETTLDDFARREWRRGDAAVAAARGTESELAAVASMIDDDRSRPSTRIDVLRCASAAPGGPIDERVFVRWLDEVVADLSRSTPDGMYLSLHGAAITTGRDTPELDALRAIRAVLGPDRPLVATFDLHANLDPAIVAPLDFATGYRTYPHVDMRETAARALAWLHARLAGAPPMHGAVVPLGMMLPSFGMRTDDAPMRMLLALARDAEHGATRTGHALDTTLLGGFPYADTPCTGASAMAWSTDAGLAARTARTLADAMAARADDFAPRLLGAREGVLRALAAGGPAAVTDPADNPLSGGAGDTPMLFATLLAMRRERGGPVQALPPGAIAFAAFTDLSVVAGARAAGMGATLDASLGARHGATFGAAVPVRARVLRITDGRFENIGPMERGAAVDVGPSAVLDVEGIEVVVTTAAAIANDPGFFALHGIDVATRRLLVVKAKNHFRAGFASRLAAIVDVDCPGPAAADLSTLPFRRAPGAVTRPV